VGETASAVEALVAEVTAAARKAAALPEGDVRMRFWSCRDDTPVMSSRQVSAPGWAEVVHNYAGRTAEGCPR
jgi:hypothetical protein